MKLGVMFKFDSAHRLMNHRGLCNNLHGHTWKVEFMFSGEVNPSSGMLKDFSALKEALENHVIEDFDHAVLVNDKDYDLKAFLRGKNMRMVTINGDPTCENLSMLLFSWAEKAVALPLDYVKVWESETSFSKYSEER